MRMVNYTGADLDRICVREDLTVRQTMEVMSREALRFVPVLEAEGGGFAGVVADGDLRRYLAGGGDLSDEVRHAANRKPTVITEPMPHSEIRSLMLRRGVEYLPQLQDGRLAAVYVLWVAASPQELTAVLMAGGLGTRLAPLTENCPKPLLDIAGRPILTHIIEHLREQGVSRFVLSVNYLSEMIEDHYGDGSALDVSIDYVHETMRMGTGGALGLADPESLSDPFLVLNGDILNDVDVSALHLAHVSGGWDATMVVREHSYTVPYGVVKTLDDGSFAGAEEKPTMYFNINAGIYMLSKAALKAVPRGVAYDLPTLFADLPAHGMAGGTYTHHGRWIDIGNIAEFNRAKGIFEGPKS